MSSNDARISVDGVGLAHAVIPVQDTSLWWNVNAFVKRTHDMIETLTNEGGDVASWMDDDNHFVIKSQSLLQSQFRRFGFQKMQKYKSFVKQLNDYRFRKVHHPSSVRQEPSDEISFDSNAVFFYHPNFHRYKPAEMVSIVDRRSIKASPKSENVIIVSEQAEKLRLIFARLESCLQEIESKLNKMLELADSLRQQLNTLSNFKSTRNASNEQVCPNTPLPRLDCDCPNLGIITENDAFSSQDFDSSEYFNSSEYFEILRELPDSEHTFPEQKFATINIASANISGRLFPFAMSTDNPDSQDEIEPIPYPPINYYMAKLSIQTSLLVCFKQRAHPLSTILKGHASSYITITTRAENRVMNDHHFSLKFNNGQIQCNFSSKSRN